MSICVARSSTTRLACTTLRERREELVEFSARLQYCTVETVHGDAVTIHDLNSGMKRLRTPASVVDSK
jgi:hypothetical protein